MATDILIVNRLVSKVCGASFCRPDRIFHPVLEECVQPSFVVSDKVAFLVVDDCLGQRGLGFRFGAESTLADLALLAVDGWLKIICPRFTAFSYKACQEKIPFLYQNECDKIGVDVWTGHSSIYPLTSRLPVAAGWRDFLFYYKASYLVELSDAGKHFAMTITCAPYKLVREVIFYEL